MGRNIKDIAGRALQRKTKDAMGRALFKDKEPTGRTLAAAFGATKKKPTGRTLADAIQKKGNPHKQGYKDRKDESIGMRTGKEADKKQSMKDRRDESYGKFGSGKGKGKINKKKGGKVKY
tara:strand:- start:171 stop:530 length:360 start_codon:yes stop_codon:yes gene_type:complete